MPRRIRSAQLETRTARLKLAPQRKPYWLTVALGIAIGYRRGAGPGTWNVRAADGKGGNWIKSFAIADDHEDADGSRILTFWQAAERAKQLARGQDADAGRPATVAEALEAYASDLAVRGATAGNATRPLHHLPPALLARPVSLLTVKELRHWRNGVAEGLKANTVNRLGKMLKAAFNLAAAHDDRITNTKAWTIGLAAIPEADDAESNLILSDKQRRAVIASAYGISHAFGLYTEVHAATGARSGQIAELNVDDLETGVAPLLRMPSSLKGRNRRMRTRKPVPITPGLAKLLKAETAGRDAAQPLLLMPTGERWSAAAHYKLFVRVAEAAGLPAGASMYCLRHTAITRALLAGVPVRLVASSFDTSVAMIEKTYSKFIADHGDAQMRRALFDVDAPADGNVVALVR
jgi:integrase